MGRSVVRCVCDVCHTTQVLSEKILQDELEKAGVFKTEHVVYFHLTPQQGQLYNAYTNVRVHVCLVAFCTRWNGSLCARR